MVWKESLRVPMNVTQSMTKMRIRQVLSETYSGLSGMTPTEVTVFYIQIAGQFKM